MSHAGKCGGSALIISLDDLSRIVTAISSKHHWTSLYFHVPLLLSVVVLMYSSPENGLRRAMIYSNMCVSERCCPTHPISASEHCHTLLPGTDQWVAATTPTGLTHPQVTHQLFAGVPTTPFDTSLQEYTLNMHKSSDVPAAMIWSVSNFWVVTTVNI